MELLEGRTSPVTPPVSEVQTTTAATAAPGRISLGLSNFDDFVPAVADAATDAGAAPREMSTTSALPNFDGFVPAINLGGGGAVKSGSMKSLNDGPRPAATPRMNARQASNERAAAPSPRRASVFTPRGSVINERASIGGGGQSPRRVTERTMSMVARKQASAVSGGTPRGHTRHIGDSAELGANLLSELDDCSEPSDIWEALTDALAAAGLRVVDLFREWDTDESGSISQSEFREALRVAALPISDANITKLFRDGDARGDSNGEIGFRELHKHLRIGGTVRASVKGRMGGLFPGKARMRMQAAVRMQASFRGHLSRKSGPASHAIKRREKQREAQVTISKHAKRKQSKKAVDQKRQQRQQRLRREKEEFAAAAETVGAEYAQRVVIGALMGLGFEVEADVVAAELASRVVAEAIANVASAEFDEEAAATRVGAAARGRMARQRTGAMRHERAVELEAEGSAAALREDMQLFREVTVQQISSPAETASETDDTSQQRGVGLFSPMLFGSSMCCGWRNKGPPRSTSSPPARLSAGIKAGGVFATPILSSLIHAHLG